jgi:type II secretion system protein N
MKKDKSHGSDIHSLPSGKQGRTLKGFRIRKIIVGFVALLVCFWAVWLAIPESVIAGYTKELLKNNNIPVEFAGIKKGFFYTIRIERVLVNKNLPNTLHSIPNRQTLILTVQNVDITPDPLSFLTLNPRLNFSGEINGGAIQGTFTGMFQRAAIRINGGNIQVNGLPILETIGIYGDGTIAFNFKWENDKGEITFAIDHADLKRVPVGINPAPLQVFKRVKGVLALTDTVTLNSLTMEGRGVYIRVKGIIREHVFDGTMEVMMDSSFDQFHLFQATLKQYHVSPGYYVIPYHQVF